MFLLNFNLLVWAQGDSAVETKVQSVEVQLDLTRAIYEGLQERVEYSISRVGERILISQPVSLLEENQESVKKAIFNVFSKVLVGFKMESIEMILAEHTKIIIRLTPIEPLVSKIHLNIEIQNLAQEITPLLDEIQDNLEAELNQIFNGLPVASIAWADGIFTLVINYLIERELPGFVADFSIEPGPSTTLNLVLSPTKPVVNEIQIKYNSSTIPIWLLQSKIKSIQSRFDALKGIPVDFLIHYQHKLERLLIEYVSSKPELLMYGLTANFGIKPGVRTTIEITLDSKNYRTNLEARYFFGEEEGYGNFQGYFGYLFNDYEVFLRGYLGEDSGGKLKTGFKLPLSTNFSGGFEYEIKQKHKNFWFHYQFERGDYLDLKIGLEDTPNEAVIGFCLNNNLNLELAQIDKEFGLQLMFHFW